MPKRKSTATASASTGVKTSKRAKKTSQPEANEQVPPIFDQVPLEILQQIVLNLEPYDYLAVKFVCKAFSIATKKSDGAELVKHKVLKKHEVKESSNYYSGARVISHTYTRNSSMETQFAKAMACIEADLSTDVERRRLTCSACGRLRDNSFSGFCDEEFEQSNAQRLCMRCLPRVEGQRSDTMHNAITIASVLYYMCAGCRLQRREKGFTREDIGLNISGTLLESLIQDHRLKKQKKQDRICGTCLKHASKDALKKLVEQHGRAKPKGKEKAERSRPSSDGNDDDDDEDY